MEDGTYVLKPGLSLPLPVAGPAWEATPPVRFLVTGEVSTIYKQGGRVRKVHLLLVLSGLEAAAELSRRLGRLGNVTADGRPILGLAARDVLTLTLEVDPQALVIPAHIWTPWFSVLGAKSGFDSLEECFGEDVRHIYALETGLSSDPPMNWRISALDRYLLVSNSDAHSPQKLGREATIFHTPATFAAVAQALRTREGFGGTLEFFPQEGKYHLDGHRKCGVRLDPEGSRAWGGRCPQCGKPLTLGVMHRVLELADREAGNPPPGAAPFASLIALPSMVGEALEVSAASKKVRQLYFRLLTHLGPELTILRQAPLEAAAREGGGLLAHALDKMRRGEVLIAGGYDGEYGAIQLLTPEERRRLRGQSAFFSLEAPAATAEAPPAPPRAAEPQAGPLTAEPPGAEADDDPLLHGLNERQRQAVLHQGPPLIVQAGPGAGKTRALTHRLAYLLARRRADPAAILAVTFTRQAAEEMARRLRLLLPDFPGLENVSIMTFHALGLQILACTGEDRGVAAEEERRALVREAARGRGVAAADLERRLVAWKQACLAPREVPPGEPDLAAAYQAYEDTLARSRLWDFEDLIAGPVRLLERNLEAQEAWRGRFRHLLVDEYQDLNEAQHRLFRLLAGEGAEIMVIGDPHQAIYGFRGARPAYFQRFQEDWPRAVSLNFTETYRLPAPILAASRQVLAASGAAPPPLSTCASGADPVVLLEAPTPAAEARAVARRIEGLVGGLSHRALEDDNLRERACGETVGFKDIAVLYRLHALGPELERAFTEAGIPCQLAKEGVGPEVEELDLRAEKVKLLTLHAAKGLEFAYVFLVGCEAGLLPWEPETGRTADPEEEVRLFYVGLTRARRQVFLTRARERTLYGRKETTRLSPLAAALNPVRLKCAPGRPAPRGRAQRRLF